MSDSVFCFKTDTADGMLASFLVEEVCKNMSQEDHVEVLNRAFYAGLARCSDMLATNAITHWVRICKSIGRGLMMDVTLEQQNVWLLENLRGKYMQVWDRLSQHVNSGMFETRMAIFKECLLLWRPENTPSSIAAFEFCAAAQHPLLSEASEDKNWTEPMRALRGKCFAVERDRKVMLDAIRERAKTGFRPDHITTWLNRYGHLFPLSEVTVMLNVVRAYGGGIELVRIERAERRACMYLVPTARSNAALNLHDDLCKKVAEFDECVQSNLIAPMGGGIGGMEADVVGTGLRMYGDIAWTFPSLFEHVRVNIVLSEIMSADVRRDMKRRAHVHAQNFFDATSQKVGVSIWMFVPNKEEVACRVRRGAFIAGDKSIEADAYEFK